MKPRQVLLFIASVIVSLALLGEALPPEGTTLAGQHVGFTSVHALVVSRQQRHADIASSGRHEIPELLQLRDSVAYYRSLVDTGALAFRLPNPHYLDVFWQAAESARLQGRTLRVLHYGDSQIEMDHISSRLRVYMQRNFGGGGPGMVPFRTITPSMTIRQSTSGGLAHLASFGDSTVVRSRGDYGPMMQCFRLSGGSAAVNLRASQSKSVDNRAKQFSRVTLVFDNRGNSFGAELTDRQHKSSYPDGTQTRGISSFSWPLDSVSNSIRLNVRGCADLYCVLVDDGPGVAVDNIPMRGCSGQQFTLIPESKLAAAYSQMDVGLIIMQFGGNSVPYLKPGKSISNYCRNLGRQIDHVRRCCPNARVLFIGPSDMSKRQQGKMLTYPALPELIDSLAATAVAHGAAYWSIYHAMGGINTMPEWTRQGLAGQDYIHFSQRGADLMGDRLSEALDNSYRLYRLERRMKRGEWREDAGKRKKTPKT